jgi:WD40 repeat protein
VVHRDVCRSRNIISKSAGLIGVSLLGGDVSSTSILCFIYDCTVDSLINLHLYSMTEVIESHEDKGFDVSLGQVAEKLLYPQEDDFIKYLKLSPDAKHCLLCTDTTVYSHPVPNNHPNEFHFVTGDSISWSPVSSSSLLHSHKKGDSIYDFCWWPGMDSNNPASCCFIQSRRDHPIHLVDAITGTLRSTFKMFNAVDEVEAATALAFNLTGDKIYAGCNRMIRIFDVNEPGNNATSQPTSKTRRASEGQKGLISCLAFNPDYSGAYAAGSYGQSVGIYVENEPEAVLELTDLGCGVTHMKWSPCGRYLWIGGRNNSELKCWDLRGTRSEVGSVQRQLSTNQKLSFDLDPWGYHLITGSEAGELLVFNTRTFELVAAVLDSDGECINSVACHPLLTHTLYCTGQRHFSVTADASGDDETDVPQASSSRSRSYLKLRHLKINAKCS